MQKLPILALLAYVPILLKTFGQNLYLPLHTYIKIYKYEDSAATKLAPIISYNYNIQHASKVLDLKKNTTINTTHFEMYM